MTAVEEPTPEAPELNGNLLLAQKLVEVAGAAEEIPKRGYNRAQDYHFPKAEDVVLMVRRELLERKVLLLAGEASTEERIRQTKGGSETAITTVHLMFVFLDAETGARIELPWPGRGEDPMDKGISKALTGALKTFLRQQLLLTWGDDAEADESTDARASGSETVNLIADAKGKTDAELNAVLVESGLPAQQKPFGAFTRIPAEVAEAVRAKLGGTP